MHYTVTTKYVGPVRNYENLANTKVTQQLNNGTAALLIFPLTPDQHH